MRIFKKTEEKKVNVSVDLKNVQYETCKLSFIRGKMRTAAWETAPQIALRDCSEGAAGKNQYRCDSGEERVHAIRHVVFLEHFC